MKVRYSEVATNVPACGSPSLSECSQAAAQPLPGHTIDDRPGPASTETPKAGKPGRFKLAAAWLWAHPFVLVLFAHTVFCLGIWNAREGYGEDTVNVTRAFREIQLHQPDSSIYVGLIAATLRFITPEPVQALTWLKYLSSLLATVSVYLALRCFSDVLRTGAILIACFVWIASSLNAPFLQSTSLSLFTFAVMLFAICCLLRGTSLLSLAGFFVLGWVAASLRPEYYVSLVLVAVVLLGVAIRHAAKRIEARFDIRPYWTGGFAATLLIAGGAALWLNPGVFAPQRAQLGRYAFFGFSQCYADFYHCTHPEEAFSPMTEYRAIVDRMFRKPSGLWEAVKNNPREAMRYFSYNTADNLRRHAPQALLGNYREYSEEKGSRHLGRGIRWLLIPGALLGGIRLYRAWRRGREPGGRAFALLARIFHADCRRRRQEAKPTLTPSDSPPHVGAYRSRRIGLLFVLAAASLPATVLLVGTPRYFLPWVPLFYLAVAFCVDSLLRAGDWRGTSCPQSASPAFPGAFQIAAVLVSAIVLCRPNYLVPRPNYEIDSLHRLKDCVQAPPRIAAWWADPAVVLGFHGQAISTSVRDGIHQADIENRQIDILVIDWNLRSTKCWADQREFFENFERQPERYGYKKLTGGPTGRFDFYYLPKRALDL